MDTYAKRLLTNSSLFSVSTSISEHKRGHGKIRNSAQDQARFHPCALIPERCAEKYTTAVTQNSEPPRMISPAKVCA